MVRNNAKREIVLTDAIVRKLLEEKPYTRDSDDLLYYEVIREVCKTTDLTAYDVFVLGDTYGLPAYETVRRTRQYVQAEREDLKGVRTRAVRKEREQIFKAYALEGK